MANPEKTSEHQLLTYLLTQNIAQRVQITKLWGMVGALAMLHSPKTAQTFIEDWKKIEDEQEAVLKLIDPIQPYFDEAALHTRRGGRS